MRVRRRRPHPNQDRFDEEYRDAEQYEFDDARHFASGRQSGESEFAQRGISHEERMRDDDSRAQFQSGYRPRDPRAPSRDERDARDYRDREGSRMAPGEGYYGSGGSYGYGGGFEHDGRASDRSAAGHPGPDFDPRRRPRREVDNEYRRPGEAGSGNEEFYEATGGFGRDVSAYGRHGFGYPGRGEYRGGGRGPQHDARGYFNEHLNRPMPGRGYFEEDAQQGFSQGPGYWQSGGGRVGASGYGRSADHSDARGHEGGGRGSHDGPRFGGSGGGSGGRSAVARPARMPKNYQRSDERIREDVCDRLGDGEVDASDISLSVREGVVTLEGAVASRYEKFHIEETVAAVSGVVDVENRLRVRRAGAEVERSEPSPTGEKSESREGADRESKAGRNGVAGR